MNYYKPFHTLCHEALEKRFLEQKNNFVRLSLPIDFDGKNLIVPEETLASIIYDSLKTITYRVPAEFAKDIFLLYQNKESSREERFLLELLLKNFLIASH